jgi:hypothetical protein
MSEKYLNSNHIIVVLTDAVPFAAIAYDEEV